MGVPDIERIGLGLLARKILVISCVMFICLKKTCSANIYVCFNSVLLLLYYTTVDIF